MPLRGGGPPACHRGVLFRHIGGPGRRTRRRAAPSWFCPGSGPSRMRPIPPWLPGGAAGAWGASAVTSSVRLSGVRRSTPRMAKAGLHRDAWAVDLVIAATAAHHGLVLRHDGTDRVPFALHSHRESSGAVTGRADSVSVTKAGGRVRRIDQELAPLRPQPRHRRTPDQRMSPNGTEQTTAGRP